MKQKRRREREMIVVSKQALALYVNCSTLQWIVRDPDGNFWVLPTV
jgi:hypothetical protein